MTWHDLEVEVGHFLFMSIRNRPQLLHHGSNVTQKLCLHMMLMLLLSLWCRLMQWWGIDLLAIRADEGHHREVNHILGSMRPSETNQFCPGQWHHHYVTFSVQVYVFISTVNMWFLTTHKHTDSHVVNNLHIEGGREYWFHTPCSIHTWEMYVRSTKYHWFHGPYLHTHTHILVTTKLKPHQTTSLRYLRSTAHSSVIKRGNLKCKKTILIIFSLVFFPIP